VDRRPEWNHILTLMSCTPFSNTALIWRVVFRIAERLNIPEQERLLLHWFSWTETEFHYPEVLRCFLSSWSRARRHYIDDKHLEEATIYLLNAVSADK